MAPPPPITPCLEARDLTLSPPASAPNSVFPQHGLYLRMPPYPQTARAQEARRPPQENGGVPTDATQGHQADLHAFQRALSDPDPAAGLRCGDDEPTVFGSCVCRVMWVSERERSGWGTRPVDAESWLGNEQIFFSNAAFQANLLRSLVIVVAL